MGNRGTMWCNLWPDARHPVVTQPTADGHGLPCSCPTMENRSKVIGTWNTGLMLAFPPTWAHAHFHSADLGIISFILANRRIAHIHDYDSKWAWIPEWHLPKHHESLVNFFWLPVRSIYQIPPCTKVTWYWETEQKRLFLSLSKVLPTNPRAKERAQWVE